MTVDGGNKEEDGAALASRIREDTWQVEGIDSRGGNLRIQGQRLDRERSEVFARKARRSVFMKVREHCKKRGGVGTGKEIGKRRTIG